MPFIDANGVSLHYALAGQHGPSVVLLHELGGTMNSWNKVAPRLAATLSRAALRPARLRAFGEGAPGILQRCAGRGFRGARQGTWARAALSFRDRRRRRDAGLALSGKASGPGRIAHAVQPGAGRRSKPRRGARRARGVRHARGHARLAADDARYLLSEKPRRPGRIRRLSRPLSGQRSGGIWLWLPRAGAHQHAAHAAAGPLPRHGGRRPPRHRAPACRQRRAWRRRFPARASS